MIRSVLFDVGGTLVTGVRDEKRLSEYLDKMTETLRSAGIVLPDTKETVWENVLDGAREYKQEALRTQRELPPEKIWSRYYLKAYGLTEDEIKPVAAALSDSYDGERMRHETKPHMKETLERLVSDGLAVGVISNMISTGFVPSILKRLGIDGMMRCVVVSAAVGVRKPSPEIFRIAAERTGIPMEETAYVGDTLSRDVLGARNAGCALSVMIHDPSAERRDSGFTDPGLKPDHYIRDLSEIPGIIKAYNDRARER